MMLPRSRTRAGVAGRALATVAAVALLLAACRGGPQDVPPLHPRIDGWPQTAVEVVTDGEVHEVAALVAASPERRQRGLQEVEDLPEGVGMLFLFDRDRTGGFWMKDTLVPLEIAFARVDGEIVAILSMEPCEADPCEVYDPGQAYRAALEVPDGWLSERGVRPGDRLRWGEVPDPR